MLKKKKKTEKYHKPTQTDQLENEDTDQANQY